MSNNNRNPCSNPGHVIGWYCPEDTCEVGVVYALPEETNTILDGERDFGDWIVEPETGAKS